MLQLLKQVLVFVFATGFSVAIEDEFYLEIKESLQKLEKQVESQNLVIKQQEEKMEELITTVERQSKYIFDQKNREINKERETKQLQKELENLNQIVKHHSQMMNHNLLGTEETRGNITSFNIHDSHKRDVLGDTEIVAFHATIQRLYTYHVMAHQTIAFDTVKLNLGGGYHAQQGLFIAPKAGLYIFSTSVTMARMSGDHLLHVIIELNGIEIAGAFGNDIENTPLYHQGSVTVVLMLKAGDQVYVNVERHDDLMLHGDGLTSFMGCLITPL